jgi:tetratricopeptide (TPR) repeat protein
MRKKSILGTVLLAIIFMTGCGAGLIQRAESNYLAHDYRTAANLFGLYLTEHPDAYLARRKFGHALLKGGQPREAVEQFENILSSHPRDSFSHLYLGLAYLRLGDYQKTLAAWQQYMPGGRPIISKEVTRQTDRVAGLSPGSLNDNELSDLANSIESAIEEALNAEQLRKQYNTSRLGDCG